MLICFSNLISAKPFYTRHRNTIKTLTDNIILNCMKSFVYRVFLRRVGDNLISKLSHRNQNYFVVCFKICNTPCKVVVPPCIWLSLCPSCLSEIHVHLHGNLLVQSSRDRHVRPMCERQSGTVSSEFLVRTSNVLSTQKGRWLTMNVFLSGRMFDTWTKNLKELFQTIFHHRAWQSAMRLGSVWYLWHKVLIMVMRL